MMGFLKFQSVWFIAAVAVACLFLMPGVFANKSYFSLEPFLELYAPLRTNKSQCQADVLYFKNHVKNRTRWALKMLDASSKIPSSLIAGNVKDLGNFDQCLAVRSDEEGGPINVIGKYCSVFIKFNETHERRSEITVEDLTKTWLLSICMPATCTPEDLLQQLEFSLKEISAKIKIVGCKSSIDDVRLPLTTWIVIIFTLCLLLLVIAATWIERKSIKLTHELIKSALLSFSLITNGKTLFSKGSELMIDSIYGIRVIAMLGVLVSHLISIEGLNLAVNRNEIFTMMLSNPFGRLLFASGIMSIEAFFLIGGIVSARGFITQRTAQVPFSFFRHIASHFLRITPLYLYIIMIRVTVLNYCGTGPMWEYSTEHGRTGCIKNWWTNLLYVNNYFGCKCMPWTWYLAAHMQLSLISPIFLCIVCKKRYLGIICIIVASLLSSLYVFQVSYDKKTHLFLFFSTNGWLYSKFIHVNTLVWASPYLIGIVIGYFLECSRNDGTTIGLLSRILGWTTSATFMAAILCFACKGFNTDYNPLVYSLFECLYRPIFGTVLGWLIVACSQGYGGWVNRFLSSSCFRVISRLSFGFYLIHHIIIDYKYATSRTAEYFSLYSLFRDMVSVVVIGLFGAAALALTVEYPCTRLGKLILEKKKNV